MNLLLELSISWLQYYAWVLGDQDTVQQELWKVFFFTADHIKVENPSRACLSILCDVEEKEQLWQLP
jgi:hypothetical protein